jgi:hypothetical protein
MMDPQSGEIIPIDNGLAKVFEKAAQGLNGDPDLLRRFPQVFRVGEEIDLVGRKYRVRKITKKDLILRPIPQALSEQIDEIEENGESNAEELEALRRRVDELEKKITTLEE